MDGRTDGSSDPDRRTKEVWTDKQTKKYSEIVDRWNIFGQSPTDRQTDRTISGYNTKTKTNIGSLTAGHDRGLFLDSVYLDGFATTLGTRMQLAVQQFAQALLVIPKQLAVNAAKDASDLVSQLTSKHYKSQKKAGGIELKVSKL